MTQPSANPPPIDYFTAIPGATPRPHVHVSLIIPIYNAARTLPRTLDSLLRIAVENRVWVQVLLIDDGSTDDSAAIAEKFLARGQFPHAQLVRQPNGGTAAARNAGLSLAGGEWVFFLDSDDELKFDPVPHAVYATPTSCTCLGFAIVIRKGVWRFRWHAPVLTRNNGLNVLSAGSAYYPPNLLARRSCVTQPFDARFPIMEDWHWCLCNPRLFDDMWVINGVTSAVVHVHGQNKSSQFVARGRDRIAIANDILESAGPLLTKKQRSNLLMQADIGRVQIGQPVSWQALGRWPCDLMLLMKAVVYFVLKGKFSKVDPYGRNAERGTRNAE